MSNKNKNANVNTAKLTTAERAAERAARGANKEATVQTTPAPQTDNTPAPVAIAPQAAPAKSAEQLKLEHNAALLVAARERNKADALRKREAEKGLNKNERLARMLYKHLDNVRSFYFKNIEGMNEHADDDVREAFGVLRSVVTLVEALPITVKAAATKAGKTGIGVTDIVDIKTKAITKYADLITGDEMVGLKVLALMKGKAKVVTTTGVVMFLPLNVLILQ